MFLKEVGVLREKSDRLRRECRYPGRRTYKVLFDDGLVVGSGSLVHHGRSDSLYRGSKSPAHRIYKAACRDSPGASVDGFPLEVRWLAYDSRDFVCIVVERATEIHRRGQWDAPKYCPCLGIRIVVAFRIFPLT